MKRLLITADDFGVHDVIDQGIINCIDSQSVNCVDTMVTFDDSHLRINKLRNNYSARFSSGDLKMGLHLSMTCGEPQYISSDKEYRKLISKNGRFKELHHINIVKLYETYLGELKKEIQAQLDKYYAIVGELPHHLSCHVGFFHLTRPLYMVYSQLAKDNNIPLRCPALISTEVQSWKEPSGTKMQRDALRAAVRIIDDIGVGGLATINAWTRNGGLRNAFNQDRNVGMVSTEYFIDNFYGQGTWKNFQWIVDTISDHSYEMVVHPVSYTHPREYADLPLGMRKGPFPGRRKEMRTLINYNIQAILTQKGISRFVLP